MNAPLRAFASAVARSSASFSKLAIVSNASVYFEFTSSSSDALAPANVFYLMGGDTIYSLKVPRGLGETIYLWLERKTSDCAVRMVLS